MTAAGRGWRSAMRAAWVPWLSTRAVMLMVGYLAARFIGFDPLPVEQAAWRVSDDVLLNLPARWDAFWYVDIARHGYQWDPASPWQQNIVFFPAYPYLMGLMGSVTGAHEVVAGLAVSLAAFYGALVYFRRLADAVVGEEAARRAVWLLALYPFALFFGAAYTESLYLLALVGAFWHVRCGQWWRGAAWGLLLGLTRPTGFLVTLPLAVVVLVRSGVGWPHGLGGLRAWGRRLPWVGLAAAAAPVIAGALHSAHLWWRFGHPLIWVTGQSAWGSLTHLATPPDPRWGAPPEGIRYSDVFLHGGNVAAALLAVVALRPIWRRIGPAEALLVGLGVLPGLLTHGPQSMGRFTAVLFPIFLWLAIGPAARRTCRWGVAFAIAQAVASALFFSWRLMV